MLDTDLEVLRNSGSREVCEEDDEVVTTARRLSPDRYISFLDNFMMPHQPIGLSSGGTTSKSK